MLKKTFLGVLFAVFVLVLLIAGINFNITKAGDYGSSTTPVGFSETNSWDMVYKTQIEPIADTYVDRLYHWKNFGHQDILCVLFNWSYPGGQTCYISFLKFNLSNIPSSAKIVSAELYLRVVEFSVDTPGVTTIKAHRYLNNTWDEHDLTWDNVDWDLIQNATSENEIYVDLLETQVWFNWTITEDVEKSKGGFLTEVLSASGGESIFFYSRETSLKPYLNITYTFSTFVGGIIWENTTWTLENSPYIITDTVQIPENVTLTIEPGVIVTNHMAGDIGLAKIVLANTTVSLTKHSQLEDNDNVTISLNTNVFYSTALKNITLYYNSTSDSSLWVGCIPYNESGSRIGTSVYGFTRIRLYGEMDLRSHLESVANELIDLKYIKKGDMLTYRLFFVPDTGSGINETIDTVIISYFTRESSNMFLVYGTICAHGNIDNKIIFDGGGNSNFFSAEGSKEDAFLDLDYCIIRNGLSFWPPTGYEQYGHFILRHSELINLAGYSYIWYPRKDSYIEYNKFINTTGFSIGHSDANVYIRYNLFKENRGFVVKNWASYGASQTIVKYNSFIDMHGTVLELPLGYYGAAMTATENYWGTNDTDAIDSMIFDKNDDIRCAGFIEYLPILSEPHPDTPTLSLIVNFTYSPSVPYAHGTVTFDASASFGPYSTIANYTWDFGDGNNITLNTPITTYTYTMPGSYNVTLAVTDEFGFKNSTTTSFMVFQDDVPPVTTDDYDGMWRNADFTITPTATDHESGVAETYYRINGGIVKAVNIDGQPRITTEGANNTLEYWSVDNAGNKEFPHKVLTGIKLDKTSSLIGVPFRIPEDDVQLDQEVKVSVNVTDSVSGVKYVTLSCLNIYKPVSNFTTVKDLNITLCLHRTTYYYEDAVSGNVTIIYLNGTAFRGAFILYIRHLTKELMSTTAWFTIDGFTKFYLSPPVFQFGPGNYAIGMSSLSTADGYIIESRWQVFPSVQVEAKDDSMVWVDLPMTFNSTTGLYEATIPGQQVNTLVKYKIVAYDNAGNYKVEDNSGEYYVYTVVPEFPSTVILLLALLFTTFAVIIGKKRLLENLKTNPKPKPYKVRIHRALMSK